MANDQVLIPQVVTVGKIPGGEVRRVPLPQTLTIRALFLELRIDPTGCLVQRNGTTVELDELISPGDTVLATTKICGNAPPT